MRKTNHQMGQSLVELVVVIAVIIIVVGALTFATIASIRNASFAKSSAQATKLAQEGLEKVRVGRDRNSQIDFTTSQTSWQNESFWSAQITSSCGITPCYFVLVNGNNLRLVGNGANFNFNSAEGIQGTQFYRALVVSDDTTTYSTQKTVTAIVTWTDFSGAHESRLTTILRKL